MMRKPETRRGPEFLYRVFVGCLLAALGPMPLAARAAQPATADSTSERMNDLLNGIPPAGRRQPENPLRESGRAVESTSPLAQIGRGMRGAGIRIRRGLVADETQQLQQRITEQLDKLIEAAGGEQGSRRNSPGRQRPARSGGQQAGTLPGVAPSSEGNEEPTIDPLSAEALRRVWGHLPKVFQEEVQAPLREDFLPKYRRLIEDYFRRLSREDDL